MYDQFLVSMLIRCCQLYNFSVNLSKLIANLIYQVQFWLFFNSFHCASCCPWSLFCSGEGPKIATDGTFLHCRLFIEFENRQKSLISGIFNFFKDFAPNFCALFLAGNSNSLSWDETFYELLNSVRLSTASSDRKRRNLSHD